MWGGGGGGVGGSTYFEVVLPQKLEDLAIQKVLPCLEGGGRKKFRLLSFLNPARKYLKCSNKNAVQFQKCQVVNINRFDQDYPRNGSIPLGR